MHRSRSIVWWLGGAASAVLLFMLPRVASANGCGSPGEACCAHIACRFPSVCAGGVCSECGISATCSDNGQPCTAADKSKCENPATAICDGAPVCTPTTTPTNTATASQTATPTATPTVTPTRIPQGGACTAASQCSTGFCADAVCCDTACMGLQQRCDVPGKRGVCTSTTAPAPAMSQSGLLAGLALLLGFGVYATWRRQSRP
jgi:hypothetical protein